MPGSYEKKGVVRMDQGNTGVLYTYSLSERIAQYMFILPWAVITLSVALIFIVWLVQSFVQIMSGVVVDPLLVVACLLVPPLLAPFYLAFPNMYPSIRISHNGIAVQVFLFWWVFIPWDDVEDIRPAGRLFRRPSRLVVVRRLTAAHRLIGWTYGWTFKPAFVIRRTLKGYDEAVRTIKEKTGRL